MEAKKERKHKKYRETTKLVDWKRLVQETKQTYISITFLNVFQTDKMIFGWKFIYLYLKSLLRITIKYGVKAEHSKQWSMKS